MLFHRAAWRFAKTLWWNPHCYTLRRTWKWPGGDDDFRWAVPVIRTIGVAEQYPPTPRGRWYVVLIRPVPGTDGARTAKFWTMGDHPLNLPDGRPFTILINRKPASLPTDRVPTGYTGSRSTRVARSHSSLRCLG